MFINENQDKGDILSPSNPPADDIVSNIENPKESTKRLLQLINKFTNTAR